MFFNFINNSIFSNPSYLVRVFESLFLSFLSLEFLCLVDFDFFPKENPISFLMFHSLYRKTERFVITIPRNFKRYMSLSEVNDFQIKTDFSLSIVQEPLGSKFYGANGHVNLLHISSVLNITLTTKPFFFQLNAWHSADFLDFRDFRNNDRTQYQILRNVPLNLGVLPDYLRISINNERIVTMGLLNRLRLEKPDYYEMLHKQCYVILSDFTKSNVYNAMHTRAVINLTLNLFYDERLHDDTYIFFAYKDKKNAAFHDDMNKYFFSKKNTASSASSTTSSTALVTKPMPEATFLNYLLSLYK